MTSHFWFPCELLGKQPFILDSTSHTNTNRNWYLNRMQLLRILKIRTFSAFCDVQSVWSFFLLICLNVSGLSYYHQLLSYEENVNEYIPSFVWVLELNKLCERPIFIPNMFWGQICTRCYLDTLSCIIQYTQTLYNIIHLPSPWTLKSICASTMGKKSKSKGTTKRNRQYHLLVLKVVLLLPISHLQIIRQRVMVPRGHERSRFVGEIAISHWDVREINSGWFLRLAPCT